MFGDAPCLGALIDRFAQHCHVLDIDAEDHDRELWRSLRKITVDTDDGPISVADFLDDAMDKPSFIPPDEREYA